MAAGTASRTIRKGSATFAVAVDEREREFWDWYETADWEPDTIAVFDRFLDASTRYVDLGAWIGPTALLAAQVVARVVCVEPDPVAREALARNLALNPGLAQRVVVYDFAVGAVDGTATLSSPGGGDSLSSTVRTLDDGVRWTVRTVGMATFAALPEVAGSDFFKIDVEGSEYGIVPAMRETIRRSRPTLYVSTHPNLVFDRSSARARVSSGLLALRLNRRMLAELRTYRHHYVWDTRSGRFADIRRRNVLRSFLPLPLRASLLVGACVFTDRTAG